MLHKLIIFVIICMYGGSLFGQVELWQLERSGGLGHTIYTDENGEQTYVLFSSIINDTLGIDSLIQYIDHLQLSDYDLEIGLALDGKPISTVDLSSLDVNLGNSDLTNSLNGRAYNLNNNTLFFRENDNDPCCSQTPLVEFTDSNSGGGKSTFYDTIKVAEELELDNGVGTSGQFVKKGTGVTQWATLTESDISDLSHTVNTDDQTLSLVTNTLSIEDGNSVDLSGYLDSEWTLSGTDLYPTTGTQVGIGTTTPTVPLHVVGTGYFSAATTETVGLEIGQGRSGDGYALVDLIGDATHTDYGLRLMRNNGGANTSSFLVHKGEGTMIFRLEDGGASNFTFQDSLNSTKAIIDSDGMGVNMNPTYPLDVVETADFVSTSSPIVRIRNHTNQSWARMDLWNVDAGSGLIIYQDDSGNVVFRNNNNTGNKNILFYQQTAKVAEFDDNGQFLLDPYKASFTLDNDYLLNINSADGKVSKVLKSSIPLSHFNDDITATEWIENTDATLTGARTITQAGFDFGFTGGNVGIGTTTPTDYLEINTGIGNGAGIFLSSANSTDQGSRLLFGANNDSSVGFAELEAMRSANNAANHSGLIFKVSPNWSASAPVEKMRLDMDGRLGIGTTSPSERLHVVDGTGAATLGSIANYIQGEFKSTSSSGGIRLNNNAQIWEVQSQKTDDAFIIYDRTNTNYAMTILPLSGDVGIGTTTPSAKLDLVGSLQLDLAGTETSGHVLTTDASGNATWQAAPAGGDPDQTLSFSNPDLTISGTGGNTVDISGVNYWGKTSTTVTYTQGVGIGVGAVAVTGSNALETFTGATVINQNASALGDLICESSSGSNVFFVDASTEDVIVNNAQISGTNFIVATDVNPQAFIVNGSSEDVVVNEGSHASTDFRVEGDLDDDVLFVDASLDRIGIKKSTLIDYDLDVNGTTRISSTFVANGASTFNGAAAFTAGIKDAGSSLGSSGQILSSTGTDIDWIDSPSGGANAAYASFQDASFNPSGIGPVLVSFDTTSEPSSNVTKTSSRMTLQSGAGAGIYQINLTMSLRDNNGANAGPSTFLVYIVKDGVTTIASQYVTSSNTGDYDGINITVARKLDALDYLEVYVDEQTTHDEGIFYLADFSIAKLFDI